MIIVRPFIQKCWVNFVLFVLYVIVPLFFQLKYYTLFTEFRCQRILLIEQIIYPFKLFINLKSMQKYAFTFLFNFKELLVIEALTDSLISGVLYI